jgi:hypothetical protein
MQLQSASNKVGGGVDAKETDDASKGSEMMDK